MPQRGAQARLPQPLPPRHIPQRTCIACRTVRAKRDLLRIVRMPTGQVVVDLIGKKAGRGAYLHRDPACWKEGLRKGRLARALHAELSAEDQEALADFMKSGFAPLAQERGAVQEQQQEEAPALKEATDGTKSN